MAKDMNARLKKVIEKKYGSVAEFCRKEPGCEKLAEAVSALINLEISPLNLDGTYTSVCRFLSEALDILTDKLFPLRLYRNVLPRGVEMTVFTDLPKEVKRDLMAIANDCDPVSEAAKRQLSERIKKVIKSLCYIDREIIRLRYGLGDGYSYTLEEVGHIFKVTRARIQQLEFRACEKLKSEKRANMLRAFLD